MLLDVSHGGTIQLQSGEVYDQITGLVPPFSALPNGTSLVSPIAPAAPAIIRYASDQGYAFKSVSANTKFIGIRFDKGGLFLEGDGCKGFIVDNCELAASVTVGPKRCGLEISGNASDGTITNNLCGGTNGAFNIFSHFSGKNIKITNNEIRNSAAGIHWGTDGVLDGILYEQNYITGCHAQAVEFQAAGVSPNCVFQDNWVENHVLSSVQAQNDAAYSYSLPMQGGQGVIIRRNVSIQAMSPNTPDHIGVRIIFEVGGKDLVCEDNYSDGGNNVVAGNGAGGTGVCRNNHFANFREGPHNSNGNTTVYTNNGPTVANSIDLIARGRPGRNRRFGSTPPIPPTDPCADVKAQLATVTAERDELKRRNDKAMPLSQQVTGALQGQ